MEIALWRYGWVWVLIAFLAMLGLLAQTWWLPKQREALALAKMTLQQAKSEEQRQRLPSPSMLQFVGQDAILTQLSRQSYADTELSNVLQNISRLAKANGLVLSQSQFQTLGEGYGGLRRVQLSLPVVAAYPQTRSFVEDVLRQLPGVSVDHLNLKREAVSQGQADIHLLLSIWIDPQKSAGQTVVAVRP